MRLTISERRIVVESKPRTLALSIVRKSFQLTVRSGLVLVSSQNRMIWGETPSGSVDGSNATFTSSYPFVPETVSVTVNGLWQKRVENFNTTGDQTVTLATSPGVGEKILINYLKA